jgi:hypothetical protein
MTYANIPRAPHLCLSNLGADWQKTRIIRTHVKQIAKRLAQHTQSEQLLTEARYYHERMQYRDFESAHLPIGSGIVESGAKQAKLRARHALVARWLREHCVLHS